MARTTEHRRSQQTACHAQRRRHHTAASSNASHGVGPPDEPARHAQPERATTVPASAPAVDASTGTSDAPASTPASVATNASGGAAQAPAPSHAAAHSASGSIPAGTGAQVPGVAPSQASQVPSQAASQQSPSTQKPLAQAAASEHALPFVASGAQVPAAVQYWPEGQPVTSHVGAHEVASAQMPLGQRTGTGRTHAPAASHAPTSVTRPAAQLAAPQAAPALRGDQSLALRVGSQTRQG